MSEVSQANRQRFRSVLLAREVKWLFTAVPERFQWILEPVATWGLRRFFLRPILRWLFVAEQEGKPHRAGEIVLAHFRRRAGYHRPTNFHSDPAVLAFREGNRAVVQEIYYLLNLDENDVRNMMELDDGLE